MCLLSTSVGLKQSTETFPGRAAIGTASQAPWPAAPREHLLGRRRWRDTHARNPLFLCFAHLQAVRMMEKVDLTLIITNHLGVALFFL